MKQRHRRWLAAVGITAALVSGCGESEDSDASIVDDDVVVSAEEAPTEVSTAEAEGDAAERATDDPAEVADTGQDETDVVPDDPAAPIAAGSVYDSEATPILRWFAPFEPGTHRTGALGTPMSFTTTEALNTQVNGGGMFVLSDIASRAPDDRDLVFMRVSAFSDPTQPNAAIEQQRPWPSGDFLGWLSRLNDGVVATDPVETTVNGLAAIRVDMELRDDSECGLLPGFCAGFAANNGHEIKALNKGASYRVWVVEQGDEDPLAIVAGIARDEDAAWFERAHAVMDTLAFGEIAANPVQELVVGPNRLDALGGVEVTLPDNLDELTNGRSRIFQPWSERGFASIPITETPGAVFFADRPHDLEGNPLASAADVVDRLTAAGAELTELDGITIGGVEARVFDVVTTDPGAIMLKFSPLDVAEDFLGWDAPAEGRIWLIEHPDRGLMMISTHAFRSVDAVLPAVAELGDAIVESLEFVDPG